MKMVKKSFILLILILLSISLMGSVYKEDLSYRSTETIILLKKINYDIDSKSIKGWVRIFRSQSRLREYDIFITETKRVYFLEYFKFKSEEKQRKYKRGVK